MPKNRNRRFREIERQQKRDAKRERLKDRRQAKQTVGKGGDDGKLTNGQKMLEEVNKKILDVRARIRENPGSTLLNDELRRLRDVKAKPLGFRILHSANSEPRTIMAAQALKAALMQYRYEEVEPARQEKELAHLTVAISAARLHVSRPEIIFIRQSPTGKIVHDSEVLGLADRFGRIWLLRGMAPRELVRVAAHETRHTKDFLNRKISDLAREGEAFLFECEFLWSLRGRTYDELILELSLIELGLMRAGQI